MAEVKLYAAEAAERAKMARSTWLTYIKRGQPINDPAPHPDGMDIESGHARPWWRPETVDAWSSRRLGPGRGSRPKRRRA